MRMILEKHQFFSLHSNLQLALLQVKKNKKQKLNKSMGLIN